MPTLGIDTKLTFSTSKARTDINSFNRALSVFGMTTKQLTLAAGASGSISLVSSEFVIVVCIEDCLTLSVTNLANENINYTNSGFLFLKANNLKILTITNTGLVSRELTIYY